jgi:hypothetical protein
MLPYQEDGKKLESLLESLFRDDDGSALENVLILGWPGSPGRYTACCTYSYGSYGA